MATQNTRDVSLRILVEAIGQEGVDKLKVALDQLGKEGAAAAPEVRQLLDQVDQLAAASAAVTTLQDLGEEATRLAEREAAAAEAVGRLKDQLLDQRSAVEAARDVQASANTAIDNARKALNDTAAEIKQLRTEYDAAGKKTDEYKDKLSDLLTQQVQQKNNLIDLGRAQREANAVVTAAGTEQTRLENAGRRAATAAQAAADAAAAQGVALTEARAAAAALGVSTDDLAASEVALAASIRQVVGVAQDRAAAVREMAESDRLLAIEQATMARLFKQSEDALLAETLAQREAARGAAEYAEALERTAAAQRAAKAASDAAAAAKAEQAESDRLAAVQHLALLELQERGQAALAAERAALADADRLTRQYAEGLQQLKNAQREAATQARAAGQAIEQAFSQVGVRSVAAVQLEIAGIRTSMALLANTAGVTGAALNTAFASGETRIRALEREIRGLTGTLTTADRAADLLKNSLGQIAAGNIIADAVGYLVNKVKELGVAFIDVTVQTERVRKGLQAVYKDTATAGAQFQFLRDEAQRSGFSISATSDAFLRFSAATKTSNIPLAVTNDLFAAVTRAGTTLGLTGEAVTGTLDALGQMASKSVVSMEELRQQLGDRLPGSLALAAKGLGITEAQLIKLVESGNLITRDFFPAFAAGLKTMAGDTDTLAASWQRFVNMLNEFTTAVSDAGGLDVLKAGISTLGVAVGLVLAPIQGFVELIGLAGQALGRFVGALTTGDFKGAFSDFGDEIDKAASRVSKFQESINVAVNRTADQTKVMGTNNAAFAKNTEGVLSLAAAQERVSAGTLASGNAFVQQLVRLQENAAATEAAVTASEKLLRAKQDESKGLVLTAQLTGNAAKALDAQSAAATANVLASQQVVIAREREVLVTSSAITAINAQRDAQGNLNKDRQTTLDKLTAQLAVQDAELEKSRQTTFELGRQALAAQTAAEAYADNSTQLGAFQQAMTNAATEASVLADQVERQTAALGELAERVIDGAVTQAEYDKQKANLAATTERLNTATGHAARFEALYKDAVSDSAAAVDRKARAATASLSVQEAMVKVDVGHLESLAALARAQGNEAQAIEFSIAAKYRQIEAVRIATRIRQLELDAQAAQIEIERAAIPSNDALREQKIAELNIRLELIKAKRIEAGASADVIRGIQAEIDATRNLNQVKSAGVIGGSAPTGGGSFVGGVEGGGKARGSGRETFTNLVPLDKATSVASSPLGTKFTADDIPFLEEAAKQARDAAQFLAAVSRQSAGAVSLAANTGTAGLVSATQRALDEAKRDQRRRTIEINLKTGGRTNTINVLDDGSADTLVGIMRQLETGASTAS